MIKCSRCKNELKSDIYKTCERCREYCKKKRDDISRIYKQGECASKDGITKKCSDCQTIKNLTSFYKNKRYKDGYRNQCIDCHSKRWKHYYIAGYANVLKIKLKTDDVYRLKQNQRSYIHQQLNKRNITKTNTTKTLLGCSIVIFKKWLSCQFDNSMNWEIKNWQVDHVVPVSLFDLHSDEERKLAFHWTNVQPLNKKDNLEKYNKFDSIQYCNTLIAACRFIKIHKLDMSNYIIIKKRLQWIKSKFSLRHFQIAGNSLEL
jgi:hypothetical protein